MWNLLIVAEGLAKGRIKRVRDFEAVETTLEPYMERARKEGFAAYLSPVFKTPEEELKGSPLFLDMVHDGRVLYDRNGFMRKVLGGSGRAMPGTGTSSRTTVPVTSSIYDQHNPCAKLFHQVQEKAQDPARALR
jgi:hypothetical protein